MHSIAQHFLTTHQRYEKVRAMLMPVLRCVPKRTNRLRLSRINTEINDWVWINTADVSFHSIYSPLILHTRILHCGPSLIWIGENQINNSACLSERLFSLFRGKFPLVVQTSTFYRTSRYTTLSIGVKQITVSHISVGDRAMESSIVSLTKSIINSSGALSFFRFWSPFFDFFDFGFGDIFLFRDSLPTENTMVYLFWEN